MHSITTAVQTICTVTYTLAKAALQAIIISASQPIYLLYALGGVIAIGLITRYTPAAICRWNSSENPYTIKSFVIESLCLYPLIYGLTLIISPFL